MRLRHLLIGIGAVFALAAIALGIFVATFDANRYKATLVDLVEKRLHRELTIDGELSLSLLPRVAISVGQARLSGPNGEGEFAQIESASIGVAPWPLLKRRIEVERVSLDGLKLDAVRHRDGSTNVDDLLALAGPNGGAPAASGAPATARSGEAAGAAAAAITIAQLQLRNAAIGWTDETQDSQWRLQQLELDADRIASGEPGRLRVSGRLIGKQPSTSAEIKASSGYTADFGTGRIELSQSKLDVRTADGVELALEAPALTIVGTAMQGKPIHAELRVRRDALKLDAALNVAAPARLQGNIDLREIEANLTASGQPLPADGLKLALVGDASVDTERSSAQVSLRGTVDGSATQVQVSAPHFSPLQLRYDLQTDRLDLDQLLGAAAAPGSAAGASKDPPAAGAPPSSAGRESAPGAAVDTAIPVPPIAGIDTNGNVRIGALRVRGIDAANVGATLRSGAGRIELTQFSTRVFQGTLSGSGALAADGHHALKMQLEGIDLGTALRQLGGREILDGRGNFVADLRGSGMTLNALERSLQGQAHLAVRDGAVLGIDLNKAIEQVGNALAAVRGKADALDRKAAGGEKTAFSSLDANFRIRDGVARNDDLDIRSPLLRVNGAGSIDLPASSVDYLLRVSLVGTLSGQGGAALSQLRGVTVPVRVSGPFTSLAYRVDVDSLARDAVRGEVTRRLEEKLLGKPKSGADASPKAPKPDPRELLRGLIGR